MIWLAVVVVWLLSAGVAVVLCMGAGMADRADAEHRAEIASARRAWRMRSTRG